MASDTQKLENIFSFLEIFFDEVDIVFEIDPVAGKILIISNNQHDDTTKITLRDGVQKLLRKRSQADAMNPMRLHIPIRGRKETMFLIPVKGKNNGGTKHLGVIVKGVENENLEGFLCRNLRKKLDKGTIGPPPGAAMMNKKLNDFKEYARKLHELNAKRKKDFARLFGELKTIKLEKEFTEENYKKLLRLVTELETERDELQGLNDQVIEENNKLINQLDEVKGVIAIVTESENEREGMARLLKEKDQKIQKAKRDKGNKELLLDKFKHLIIEVKEDGTISYCNKNVEKFYADTFGKTGVAGNKYPRVLKSDELPKIETAVSDAISEGKDATIDVRLHKRNPKKYKTEKVFFKLVAFPMKKNADGEKAAGILMWQT